MNIRLGGAPDKLCFHHSYWNTNKSCHGCLEARTINLILNNNVLRRCRDLRCPRRNCVYCNEPFEWSRPVSWAFIATESSAEAWILGLAGIYRSEWIEIIVKNIDDNPGVLANKLTLPLFDVHYCQSLLHIISNYLCTQQMEKPRTTTESQARISCKKSVDGQAMLSFLVQNPADPHKNVIISFSLSLPVKFVTQVNLFIELHTETDLLFASGEYTIIDSYLRSKLEFSKRKFCYQAHITGQIHHLNIEWPQWDLNNLSLEIQWEKGDDAQSIEVQGCSQKVNLTSFLCHNYTLLPSFRRRMQSHLLFLFPEILHDLDFTPIWSWKTAAGWCEYLGGHLPVLRDKDHLNDFESVLQLASHLCPVEIVPLGLFITDSNQVGFTSFLHRMLFERKTDRSDEQLICLSCFH